MEATSCLMPPICSYKVNSYSWDLTYTSYRSDIYDSSVGIGDFPSACVHQRNFNCIITIFCKKRRGYNRPKSRVFMGHPLIFSDSNSKEFHNFWRSEFSFGFVVGGWTKPVQVRMTIFWANLAPFHYGMDFEKKEVTRARILVPHSNKNQLEPIYSFCSQLLKHVFAKSSS